MEIADFIEKRTYLYHLTSPDNLNAIFQCGQIFSTNELLLRSTCSQRERETLSYSRRPEHVYININGNEIMIRDQRPVSIKALEKCLTGNWKAGDFINHLNERVFFWPTLKRLNTHYTRYLIEGPSILRISTEAVLDINDHVKFCRLNSGATRCSHHYGGAPPPRGEDTFRVANEFDYEPQNVAEVTFESSCRLPRNVWISSSPEGPWEEHQLE